MYKQSEIEEFRNSGKLGKYQKIVPLLAQERAKALSERLAQRADELDEINKKIKLYKSLIEQLEAKSRQLVEEWEHEIL